MAQVIYSLEALKDLDRVERFFEANARMAAEALLLILDCVETLAKNPEIGRPVRKARRELVISRGRSGYLALYEYDPRIDLVRALRIRHQREAGYPV